MSAERDNERETREHARRVVALRAHPTLKRLLCRLGSEGPQAEVAGPVELAVVGVV